MSNRLDFLWSFLVSRGVSVTQSPTTIGLAIQMSSYWKRKDDMSVSTMLRLVQAQGFKLKITILREGDTVETAIPSGKRLGFLTQARQRYGIKVADWSQKIKVGVSSICHWNTNDDILWSQVCRFASVFGLNIHTEFICDDDCGQETALLIHSSMTYSFNADAIAKGKRDCNSSDNLSRMWRKNGAARKRTEECEDA